MHMAGTQGVLFETETIWESYDAYLNQKNG